MKITMSGKGFEISDSLRERVEKKLAKLDRYFREDAEANVRVAQEQGNRNIVEITIAVNGLILRAEETSGDMYASIDGAADKLNRQIRRYRTKLEKRLREDIPAEIPGVDDAIAQMELLDHDFFLFRDEETDGICLIYRRNDGAYGLLQPE